MPTPVTTNITELPESRVRVQAEVAPEEVERRLQQAARALGRELRIPGFRKGKVPPPVVIRRLGREAVLDEALRSSLGNWYVDAIDAAGIATVGEPELDVGDLPAEGKPLSFSIEIGVRPRAQLGDYKGLEVGRREAAIDDAALDAELEQLRERIATLETVERPAENGDYVVLDYVGRLGDEPLPDGEQRDQLIELGSGRLIAGFEEQLLGARAGEERELKVTFPEDYGAEQLAGQEATFDVKVSEVKAKRLAELDDEFASEAAGIDTLQELRDDIADRLRQAEEHAIEHEFEQAVLDAAVAGAEIEVPAQLVHARAHELVEETLTTLARQGVSKETYLRVVGKDEEELAETLEPEAEQALRRDAVIAAIVEAERIEPADEELLEAVAPSAERAKLKPQKLLDRLRSSGGLARLREDVAARQAVELIVGEAKPISVEQARARNLLWTPGKDEPASGRAGAGSQRAPATAGQLWTPST